MASLLLGPPPPTASLRFSQSHSVAGAGAVCLSSPPSLSLPTTSAPLPLIYCGRGDRKTAKGKRFSHSFGNARPRNKKKGRGPPKSPITREVPSGEPSENEAIED